MDICPDLTFNMAQNGSVTPKKEDAERNIAMRLKDHLRLRTTSELNHDQESAKQKADKQETGNDGFLDCNLTT